MIRTTGEPDDHNVVVGDSDRSYQLLFLQEATSTVLCIEIVDLHPESSHHFGFCL